MTALPQAFMDYQFYPPANDEFMIIPESPPAEDTISNSPVKTKEVST